MSICSLSVLVLDLSNYITSEFLGILNLLGTFDRLFIIKSFFSKYKIKIFLVIRDSGFVYYFYLN
jgi:hypothetical protein